jgi:hypothetical protein
MNLTEGYAERQEGSVYMRSGMRLENPYDAGEGTSMNDLYRIIALSMQCLERIVRPQEPYPKGETGMLQDRDPYLEGLVNLLSRSASFSDAGPGA